MSDRTTAIMELVALIGSERGIRDKIEQEVASLETDLMQHATESARLRNCLSESVTSLAALKAERDNLYRCVKWYADGNHYNLGDWDDVDEPNWLFPPGELEATKADHTPFDPKVWPKPAEPVLADISGVDWGVENGGIARFVLAGGVVPADFDTGEDDAPLRLSADAVPLEAPK